MNHAIYYNKQKIKDIVIMERIEEIKQRETGGDYKLSSLFEIDSKLTKIDVVLNEGILHCEYYNGLTLDRKILIAVSSVKRVVILP